MTDSSHITAAQEARALLGRAVESLIALLDLLKPDPDLEDNDAEPDADGEPAMGWQNEGSQIACTAKRPTVTTNRG